MERKHNGHTLRLLTDVRTELKSNAEGLPLMFDNFTRRVKVRNIFF